ncbi:MAG: hypothetical protein AABY10_05180, partial [Nanoarchaeota archaeon]
MAEKNTRNKSKELIEPTIETLESLDVAPVLVVDEVHIPKSNLDSWMPKTKLGKAVKEGKIKDINLILSEGKKILEPEIIDWLIPVETDLLSIGQAKGKFGGGKRRAWRQTQKKTQEGNVLSFSAMAVVGD